jgi:hypothetical protein
MTQKGEAGMRMTLRLAAIAVSTSIRIGSAFAQNEPELALNNPDKLAWVLFLKVNADAKSAGNNNALFETWASDGDTFQTTPAWPATAGRLTTAPRALSLVLRGRSAGAHALPQVVPGGAATEETRRNKPDFKFIVDSDFYKVSELETAYAANKTLTFPIDSLEVKANWVEVNQLKAFNGFSGTPADTAKLYHVNTAGNTQYALVSMHVISKLAPNWTWATFEQKDNPGRCDVIGCKDAFGAQQAFVPPISPVESKQHYPDCVKTTELTTLFAHADLDPAYANYCLKGSQSDFTDATGLAIRLGNSVTENGFVDQASCITCHGRAAVDPTGKMTSFAGFGPISISLPLTQNAGNAPVGPIDPNWFWVPGGPPSFPVLANESDISRIAMAVDFVWSIPFCAIDDTANPPQTTSRFCAGK